MCGTCRFPEQSTTYILEMTDINGCKVTDEVTVFVNGTLYVPNTFTPDGDGVNDGVFRLATEIAEFRMLVFNRWGERRSTLRISSANRGTARVRRGAITHRHLCLAHRPAGTEREEVSVFGHVNLVR